MTTAKAKKYLETQVKTASKEQLLMMLIDGGIRFARQGKQGLADNDFVTAFQSLVRSQKIVMELLCALDKSIMGQDLYNSLASLYKFIYFRLVEASLRKSEAMVDEALDIYTHLRQTWSMAIEKQQQDGIVTLPEAGQVRPQCAISIQG